MKKLYMVQVGFSFDKSLVYLPYAAGCIAASAFADEEIAANYERPVILFERDTLENNLAKIKDPDVVTFSTNFWNIEYNRQLARLVKEKYPDCFIVTGGHSITPDSVLLDEQPSVDAVLYGEGEKSFPLLLKCLLHGDDLDIVPGAMFRKDGNIIRVPQELFDLDDCPSPYLTGIFDPIMEEHPDIMFNMTVETNRGCPYTCAYCEWSHDRRIRLFPLEKVKAEIRWASDHRLEYIYCADSNFGIVERDIEIAQWVVDVRKKNGYPNIFKPCYAKNSNDTVFEAGRILNAAGADKGITISYQTLCPEALRNINRENLDMDVFTELSKRYNAIGIPTYSDLILGLPGESFESFSKTLCDLMEIGQHNSVTFHHCQVYPNAPMGDPEYQKKYQIEVTEVPIDAVHYTPNFSGVYERFHITTGSYSMSHSDWEKTNVYAVCVEAFHHIGLVRCFALYMRNEMGMSYLDFYNRLFAYVTSHPETLPGEILQWVNRTISDTENPWAYQKDVFGSTGWYFEEGLFLECAYALERYTQDMMPFFSSLGIPEDVFGQLLKYQTEIIRQPGKNEMHLPLEYDFYNYFRNIYSGTYAPLNKVKNTLHIKMEKTISAWDEYAREIIWFGKRRSATLATNDREQIEVEYIR